MRVWVKTSDPEISFRLQGRKITHFEYLEVTEDHNVRGLIRDKSLIMRVPIINVPMDTLIWNGTHLVPMDTIKVDIVKKKK